MTPREILKALIDERFGGNQSAFARAVGRTAPQINQYLSGYRNLDVKFSRLMEQKLMLPEGYFLGESNPYEIGSQDQQFINRIQQEVARYDVPEVIKDAIIGMIKQQPPKHAGSSLGEHPPHEQKAA